MVILELINIIITIKINHKLRNLLQDKSKSIKKKAKNGNNIPKSILKLFHHERIIDTRL
jgi:cell division protein FtsL